MLRFLLAILVALPLCTTAQQIPDYKPGTPTIDYLAKLFWCGATFDEITSAADAHFAEQYPGLRPAELCTGEHRDGDFVKYQRWKAFWQNHLMPDGTLGDYQAARGGFQNQR